MGFTLREKLLKLQRVPRLPQKERQEFTKVLDMIEGPLEGALYPDTQAHIEGRFEWYFKPDGTPR